MEFPRVWDESRPSIYAFVRQRVRDHGSDGLLPDDELIREGRKVSWAAGAFDGAFGHHGDSRKDVGLSQTIFAATSEVVFEPTPASLERLYELVIKDNIVGFIDPFLSLLSEDRIAGLPELPLLARWLATEAPDRGAVKFGLALLGQCGDFRDEKIFMTLGGHEEFTLYAAVAVTKTLFEPEPALWDLAMQVHGWGRIQLVERLRATENPAIKAWMLREGFRNQIMYEYLAHCCATTGGLLSALQSPERDDALLLGAGEIIDALLAGGPAKDIDDYPDGVEAIGLYLEHLERRPAQNLTHFIVVSSIQKFLENPTTNWSATNKRSWSVDLRQRIILTARSILSQAKWPILANRELLSDDERIFRHAATILETLGLDPWEARFERQRSGRSEQWHFLMKTDNFERVNRVIALASDCINLGEIASGPADEVGLGPGFRHHWILDWILQELPRFPGTGWPLVAAALRSPVVRNRNYALGVLDTWTREAWPPDARTLLEGALAEEPVAQVYRDIRNLLEGHRLTDGDIEESTMIH
jgi:hypothetical protein